MRVKGKSLGSKEASQSIGRSESSSRVYRYAKTYPTLLTYGATLWFRLLV